MSEPIYNAKVNKIIELLKFMNRDEAAAKLNYKNYKSLDMYMRRKNFTFDPEEQQYVPMQTRVEKMKKDPKSYAPTKVVSIITAFEEEGVDPKVVAKQAGFNDHKDMAEYMKAKGYEWNVYKNNYVKTVGKVEETVTEEPLKILNKATEQKVPERMEEYIPFIRFLYEKRDDLYQILSGVKEDGTIPRYTVPGLVRTKAIYMSDMVARLTAEFSQEKNVTQREIVEAALIEFLQKYGYKNEIDALLKNK